MFKNQDPQFTFSSHWQAENIKHCDKKRQKKLYKFRFCCAMVWLGSQIRSWKPSVISNFWHWREVSKMGKFVLVSYNIDGIYKTVWFRYAKLFTEGNCLSAMNVHSPKRKAPQVASWLSVSIVRVKKTVALVWFCPFISWKTGCSAKEDVREARCVSCLPCCSANAQWWEEVTVQDS